MHSSYSPSFCRNQVYLLQALVRGETYPTSKEEFQALSKHDGKSYFTRFALPLAAIDADPLFAVGEGWMRAEFDETLAGKRIARPTCTEVGSMMMVHGNRRVTWHAIFDCGEITPAQVCLAKFG